MILELNEKFLHDQFVQYGSNAKEWLRKCALLLQEIDRKKIWKKKGFSSIQEYAGKLAGMSRTSVDDALRILRKIENKPAPQKVVQEKDINAVRPVAAIATSETADFWAEKAHVMSRHTLETYVREHQKLKGHDDWNTLMKEFLELRKEKLRNEKPEAVKTESRHIPEKIKRFVLNKTRGQCAYPGCAKPYKILHHTQRWVLENIHDPDRLVPLCIEHERLAHHGLIAHDEDSTEKWQILDHPIWWEKKRMIDQIVMEYRNFSSNAGLQPP